jgi:1-acyl-sn-glycerol-3-phosphate acyltransferase
MYRFCRFSVWVLASLFYRHKVYGKNHIPAGGAMIASNHCSFLDPQLVGISCRDQIHFLARDTLFAFRPFGWLLRQLNTHPVHRGKGNLGTLKMTMELLRSGKKVVIFPEGKRSPDGELQKGQLGIGMLVQRTGCRIIPVYTHGTFEAWNNKRKFPKLFGKTACVFGTPIEYSESLAEDKKEAQAEIVDKIMEKISELRTWYLAGAKGSPP